MENSTNLIQKNTRRVLIAGPVGSKSNTAALYFLKSWQNKFKTGYIITRENDPAGLELVNKLNGNFLKRIYSFILGKKIIHISTDDKKPIIESYLHEIRSGNGFAYMDDYSRQMWGDSYFLELANYSPNKFIFEVQSLDQLIKDKKPIINLENFSIILVNSFSFPSVNFPFYSILKKEYRTGTNKGKIRFIEKNNETLYTFSDNGKLLDTTKNYI